MRWNDQQRLAVEARGCNLLLSAAAGAGKTTVLVERIRSLVAEGIDIDRMLIVTFTRAAAAEMREKILLSLQTADKDDAHAARFAQQASLVERAQISTLHTFCAALLREHFQASGLDPSFRVSDEREAAPLREGALRAVLAQAYEEAGGDFAALSARFSDAHIHEQLLSLYSFLLTQPEPWAWLEAAVAQYDAGEDALERGPWVAALLGGARARLASASASFAQAISVCEQPDSGCSCYLHTLESDLILTDALREASHRGYTALREAVSSVSFKKLSSAPSNSDPALKIRAQALRNHGKESIQKLSKELLAAPLADHAADLQAQIPQLRALAALARALHEEYAARKSARNLLDFSDLEHKALEAVRQPAVAAALRMRYEAIFVDEYQDSSVIQEELIQRIARENNVFLVGDVKQSIYRFRQAEPGLFLRKLEEFSSREGARDRRIDLNWNYRSRANILNAVNQVFAYAMRREETEIPYDEEARLRAGREPREAYPDPEVELHLLDTRPEDAFPEEVAGDGPDDGAPPEEEADRGDQTIEPVGALAQEALLAARRIRELVNTPLWDEKRKIPRKVRYRDIVILLRVAKAVAQPVQRLLEQQGIPVFCDAGDPYFALPEVRTVIDLLRAVDNPRNDTALIGALHGPTAHIGNDALLAIRRACPDPKGIFYDAVLAYAAREDDLALRLKRFLETLDALRLYARAQPLEDLLWRVYEQTGCYARAGALPGGSVRQANLRMLAERAAAFEQRSEGGLAAFLWEAEQLHAQGDTFSAKALGEGEDVVRIMTMHMSKGLEFPIVICLDLNRSFLRKGGAATALSCHTTQGLALRMIDPALRIRYNTLPCTALSQQKKKEALADTTRLLYVAMTRAMDRLILIGRGSHGRQTLDERLQRWAAAPGALLSEAESMLDLLLPAIGVAPGEDIEKTRASVPLAPRWLVHRHGRVAPEERAKGETSVWLADLKAVLTGYRAAPAIEARLEWAPPPALAETVRLKTTVSALLRRAQGEEAYMPPVHWPLFLEEGAGGLGLRDLSGAARGTAFHAAMRGLDLPALRGQEGSVLREAITRQLDALVAADRLRMNERLAVREEEIAPFFESELGQRMLASEVVRREWAFNLRMGEGTATQLVQGVLDCCFLEPLDGSWVLVDYKTDSDPDPEAVLARYAPQITLYVRALTRITPHPVSLAALYLTKKGKTYPYALSMLSTTGEDWPGGESFK